MVTLARVAILFFLKEMKLDRATVVQFISNLLIQLVEPILQQMKETRVSAAGKLLALRRRKAAR
jgi:hypothetical protein